MKAAIILVSITLALVVVGALYAAGPKYKCDRMSVGGDRSQGRHYCKDVARTSAWERISGTITGG
jgi:hypothetical protein